MLLRRSQECFKEERKAVESQQPLDRKSKLKRLDIAVNGGLIRIRGRIDVAEELDRDLNQPVVLDAKDDITKLILTHYHDKFNPGNHATVMNEVRRRFWVLGLRSAVREIAHRCQWCLVPKGTPKTPPTGDLPREQLRYGEPPFTSTRRPPRLSTVRALSAFGRVFLQRTALPELRPLPVSVDCCLARPLSESVDCAQHVHSPSSADCVRTSAPRATSPALVPRAVWFECKDYSAVRVRRTQLGTHLPAAWQGGLVVFHFKKLTMPTLDPMIFTAYVQKNNPELVLRFISESLLPTPNSRMECSSASASESGSRTRSESEADDGFTTVVSKKKRKRSSKTPSTSAPQSPSNAANAPAAAANSRPSAPQAPATQALSKAPQAPKTPKAPRAPQAPKTPKAPQAPQAPTVNAWFRNKPAEITVTTSPAAPVPPTAQDSGVSNPLSSISKYFEAFDPPELLIFANKLKATDKSCPHPTCGAGRTR
ncbi:unnamed protein product [Danaus chrysippus]|uniref:(African queen) hypothetical protein n=1 Tax=Danaus chrysippus TaxID=151541 RepID=A0A8J2R8H9_9NEOP|nr:unnamed protein product [Danaus chrysippus]